MAVGESFAVEKLGATLLHQLDGVKVRALPADLPQTLEADISPLLGYDDVIHAGDLPLPPTVTLITDPGDIVLRVQPPRVEEAPVVEEAEAEEAAEAEAEEGAEAEPEEA